MVTVAAALVAAAARREETRGCHWREDFPDSDRACLGHRGAVGGHGATALRHDGRSRLGCRRSGMTGALTERTGRTRPGHAGLDPEGSARAGPRSPKIWPARADAGWMSRARRRSRPTCVASRGCDVAWRRGARRPARSRTGSPRNRRRSVSCWRPTATGLRPATCRAHGDRSAAAAAHRRADDAQPALPPVRGGDPHPALGGRRGRHRRPDPGHPQDDAGLRAAGEVRRALRRRPQSPDGPVRRGAGQGQPRRSRRAASRRRSTQSGTRFPGLPGRGGVRHRGPGRAKRWRRAPTSILLDNMSPATICAPASALARPAGRAAGGQRRARRWNAPPAVAEPPGVDYLAVGALTHSAPGSLDLGLDLRLPRPAAGGHPQALAGRRADVARGRHRQHQHGSRRLRRRATWSSRGGSRPTPGTRRTSWRWSYRGLLHDVPVTGDCGLLDGAGGAAPGTVDVLPLLRGRAGGDRRARRAYRRTDPDRQPEGSRGRPDLQHPGRAPPVRRPGGRRRLRDVHELRRGERPRRVPRRCACAGHRDLASTRWLPAARSCARSSWYGRAR